MYVSMAVHKSFYYPVEGIQAVESKQPNWWSFDAMTPTVYEWLTQFGLWTVLQSHY